MSLSSVVRARSTSASRDGSRAGAFQRGEQRVARAARAARPSAAIAPKLASARIVQHALVAPDRGWRGRSAPARGAGVPCGAVPQHARRARRPPGSPGARRPARGTCAATICMSPARRSVTERSPSCVGSPCTAPAGRAPGAGSAPKCFSTSASARGLVELAADDQQRVVGLVPGAVERLQPLDRHRLDVGARSRSPGCRSCARRRRGAACAASSTPPGLFSPHLELVAHHGHLAVEVLLAHERVHHAVGFQAERPVQVVLGGGQRLEVVGAVVGGGAVEARAALA